MKKQQSSAFGLFILRTLLSSGSYYPKLALFFFFPVFFYFSYFEINVE